MRVPARRLDGGVYAAEFSGPPFELGARLRYAIRATDSAGREGWYPPDAPERWSALQIGVPTPALIDVAPREGPATGGTAVLLRGAGFHPGVLVRFGAHAASVEAVHSPHLLTARTPAHADGAAVITVESEGGTARLEGRWRFVRGPGVTGVSPAEGPTAGGTLVALDGTDLQPGATVLFDDRPGVEPTWISEGRLVVTTPESPPGAAVVTVQNPDGQLAASDLAFRFWPPPRVDAVEPDRGTDLGGGRVEIIGEHLRAPGAVYFGDRSAGSVTVAEGGRVATVISPRHPAGVVDVAFYNPDGQWDLSPLAFRFVGPPQLFEADPGEISRCGGTVVTLGGANFEAGMRVYFNGVEGEVLAISEDGDTATVRAPPGEPGAVLIEVRNPDGRTAQAFELVVYGVQPSVRAVDPSRVPVWGGVWVEIDGADFEPGAEATFDEIPAEATEITAAGCDSRARVRVPAHEAGPAEVTVRNPDGRSGRLPAGVEYVAPRVEPSAGLTPGYTNARIVGVDLRAGMSVRFGNAAPRQAERVSDELWRVLTPAGPRGPVPVEIRVSEGRGVVLDAGFTYHVFVDQTESRLTAIGDCNGAALFDVDGDGDLDVVTANGALSGLGQVDQDTGLHRNDGAGRFTLERLTPAGNGMNVSVGDLNGDGTDDVLIANLSSARNHFFRNDAGRLRHVPDFPAIGPSYDAVLVDLLGNDLVDVFLLQVGDPEDNARRGPEQLWINEGAGSLRERSEGFPFNLADVHDHDVAFGDLDGDGLVDAVIVVDNLSDGFAGAENRIVMNRGGGRFERIDSPINDYPGDWLKAELVDVNADGHLDIVMPQDYIEGFSRPGTPAVAVFLNDGRGRFSAAHDRLRGMPRTPAFSSTTVDVDGDGDLDMLIAVYGLLYSDGSIDPYESVLLLNDGSGIFFEASSAFIGPRFIASSAFLVGDLDGSGRLDLFECAARAASRVWMQTP